MKKIILVIITSILIFTCFLTTKKAHADITDIFLNNEIYLFNNINEINFNEGYYIDKTTISEEDKNNDSNNFMWYFNLGHRLVAENFPEDSGGYKCLAIPLNNMVAKYVAFAFGFSRGPDLAIEIRYSDNSVVQYATSDYTDTTKVIYTPSQQNLTKNIAYIAWEIYDPDYYISFLPLTSEGYYNIGYNDGLSDGFDEGLETGYNRGYYDGYNNGISSDNILYTTILDFNQLILNGNFDPNVNYWVKTSNNINFTYQENYGAIQILDTQATNYTLGIRTPVIRVNQNDKLYTKLTVKSETNNFTLRLDPNGMFQSVYFNVTNTWQTFNGYHTALISTQQTLWFYPYTPEQLTTNEYYYLKNIQLFNLTKMYGAGNEPTIEQCEEIFNKEYYDYTQSTPVEIGYYTGYIEGRDEGIQTGINIGETNQINISWISSVFDAISGFLSIQIFPRVTVGVLVMIPFILTFTGFIIGVIRKGGDKGGDDE